MTSVFIRYTDCGTGQLSKSDVVFTGIIELQTQLEDITTSLNTLQCWPSLSDDEIDACQRILDETATSLQHLHELTHILHSQSSNEN